MKINEVFSIKETYLNHFLNYISTTEVPRTSRDLFFLISVAFYKRAQILIADIWACFEGQGLGNFSDIDTITMFADYRSQS